MLACLYKDVFNSFHLYSEEVIVVFLMYIIYKFIFFLMLTELIWPTHFFNKRQNINYISYKNHGYLDGFVKIFFNDNAFIKRKFFLYLSYISNYSKKLFS